MLINPLLKYSKHALLELIANVQSWVIMSRSSTNDRRVTVAEI